MTTDQRCGGRRQTRGFWNEVKAWSTGSATVTLLTVALYIGNFGPYRSLARGNYIEPNGIGLIYTPIEFVCEEDDFARHSMDVYCEFWGAPPLMFPSDFIQTKTWEVLPPE